MRHYIGDALQRDRGSTWPIDFGGGRCPSAYAEMVIVGRTHADGQGIRSGDPSFLCVGLMRKLSLPDPAQLENSSSSKSQPFIVV